MNRKKWCILLLIQIAVLLAFIPGCLSGEKNVFTAEAEQISTLIFWRGETPEYIGTPVIMRPGVYEVRVKSDLSEDGLIVIEPHTNSQRFGALQGNQIVLQRGQTEETFEFYIKNRSEEVYFTCLFQNTPETSLVSYDVILTNRGNRRILIQIFALFLVLNLVLYIKEKKETGYFFWGLLSAVLISFIPYMTGYLNLGADTAFHISRIEGFKETLLQGNQFPVRVQSTWLYGHGYEVSTFYGDLFLIIPAFLRMMGFSMLEAYRSFVFLVTIGTATSSYFCFRRCFKDRRAAFWGSFFYMLAPYRIYNYYNRGAVGEYLAMMLFPVIFCGMYILYRENTEGAGYKEGKYYLIAGLTALLQSHLLSTEIVLLLLVITALISWKRTFGKDTFKELTIAGIITILINAWFWVPLLYEMMMGGYYFNSLIEGKIQESGIHLARIFQFYPNMGLHQIGMFQCEPIQIGIASFVMIFGFLMFGKKDREGIKYAICTLLFVILSTRYFPWDMLSIVPVMKTVVTSLQFPTRMMEFAAFFAAVFACYFSIRLEERYRFKVMAVLAVLLVGSAVYHVNSIFHEMTPIYLYAPENMGSTQLVYADYLPEGTKREEYRFHNPVVEGNMNRYDYRKNGTEISLFVENTADKSGFIELPLTGYRGYEIEEEGPVIAKERGEHGDLRIEIPAGYDGWVHVSYRGIKLFRIAGWISAGSIVIFLIFGVGIRIKRHEINK